MTKYVHWILLNIFLPLLPFLIKVFILFIGKEGVINFNKIAEIPELIYFSIFTCLINLNINLDGNKGIFETVLRVFIMVIVILDCVTLGMIYSNNIGSNINLFVITVVSFPALIAPFYKFFYIRKSDFKS